MRFAWIFIALLYAPLAPAQQFSTDRIVKHISILANDSLGGRGTGTPGELAARRYIENEFRSLKLVPKGDNGTFAQAFSFSRGFHGQGESGTSYNIIGYLDNKASSTVVIGAHYDHLGHDGQGSSLDANPKEKIHNGADDNASGVAGVIELARYYSTNKIREKKNFLFICFSGEELGLLGSKHFTENSSVNLSAIDCMINMDMIGRLNPVTKSLVINGTGTSPSWEPVIRKIKPATLNISMDSSGTGPSDHTSFYLKNIPVLHFFTGSHSDYHKPSDDTEKINSDGEAEILKLIARIINELDATPKLTFLKTKTKQQNSMTAFKVTLGIMPSYSSEGKGLKVDGVSDGKPAAIAGIQSGDVILQLGPYEIKDIYGYMDALSKFEKDQTIPVRLKRGEQELTLQVTF